MRDTWFRIFDFVPTPQLLCISALFLWRLYGRHYAAERGYWIDRRTRHVFHYTLRVFLNCGRSQLFPTPATPSSAHSLQQILDRIVFDLTHFFHRSTLSPVVKHTKVFLKSWYTYQHTLQCMASTPTSNGYRCFAFC